MANPEHLQSLMQGVEAWNRRRVWNLYRDTRPDLSMATLSGVDLRQVDLREADLREAHLSVVDLRQAELSGADLRGADLRGANLRETHLRGADLSGADLRGAHLRGADLREAHLSGVDLNGADLRQVDLRETHLRGAELSGADLSGVDLSGADLSGAHLRGAELSGADLSGADLSGADLSGADLRGATLHQADLTRALLLETNFEGADLTGCFVFGISAWNVKLEGTTQLNLVITPADEPVITVDNLEVAQFIYLLLHNEKIREVIDTIGRKGVLVLGRFAGERKAVLDALRTALRSHGFLPMVFDFEKPTQRDFTETIMTLAGMSLFVIADITKPRSTPLELQATVPDYMIPFVPILAEGELPFAMFIDLQRKFDWVLEVLTYDSIDNLLAGLQDAVIAPALQKHEALVQRRARAVGTRHIQQYLPHGDAHP
jgi:uncharacterized protein YjbI with pentapeptide repeats